jgi:hypothetical protein
VRGKYQKIALSGPTLWQFQVRSKDSRSPHRLVQILMPEKPDFLSGVDTGKRRGDGVRSLFSNPRLTGQNLRQSSLRRC